MPEPEVVVAPAVTPVPEVTVPPQENGKTVTNGVETPVPETPVVESIETNHITKDEEGNFVLPVDPENPEGTVYKGKSLDELLFNVKKGIIEKDGTITRMKAQGFSPKAGKDANVKGNAPLTDEVVAPNDDKILNEVLKEYGVDPKVMNWTDEEWKDFERENLATQTWALKQKVERVQAVFDSRISEENVVYVNNLNLANEVTLAVDTLVENGYSPSDINLDEVIERVKDNLRYWQKDGVRIPGAIATELTKEITKRVQKTTKTDTEKKIALGIKTTPKAAPKSTSVTTDNPDDNKKTVSQRYHVSDAAEEIKREMRAKGQL